MKKFTKFLFIPACAILIAGCSKEPAGNPSEAKEYKTKEVRIGVKLDDKTKVAYDLDEGFTFSEGDKIGLIFHLPQPTEIPEIGFNRPFTFQEYNEEEDTYYFGGAIIDDDETVYNFCAYYPYKELGYSSNQIAGNNYYFWPYSQATVIRSVYVPAVQEYLENGWKDGIMGATFTGTADKLALTFKPFYNVLKFTVEIPSDAEVSFDELKLLGILLGANHKDERLGVDGSLGFGWHEDGTMSIVHNSHPTSLSNIAKLELSLPSEGITISKGESHDFYFMISYGASLYEGINITLVAEGYQPVVAKINDLMPGFDGNMNIFTFPNIKLDQELTAF